MLRAQFNKFGKASQEIYLHNVKSIESLKKDEILIKILFFPINPADLLLVEGKYSFIVSSDVPSGNLTITPFGAFLLIAINYFPF